MTGHYGKGQVETFRYNSWGKLIASSKVDASTKRSATYAYDYFGRMVEKVETAVENGKESKTVSRYAYNNYGQRTGRVTTADGVTFSEKREYDEFGRLTKIVSGSDTVTYAYNTKNQLVTRTTNGIAVRYSYTKLGQLAAKSIAGMEDAASLKYFYDKDGTISGREVGGVKQSYKYDKIGQLLAVIDPAGKEVEKYVYDPAGNILSKTVAGRTTTYTYDKANQLVSSKNADGKVTKYEYDAAGRMVKEGEKTFAYGWLDKVMQVAENGKTTQSYSYDISGQLATADYGAGKETFLWDGLALLSRNNLKYVNEPAVTGGNPILAGDKMLFDDMLGNTLGVKDGEKFSAIDRDAFGELKPGEKPNLSVNFFTGKPEIDGLGYSFLFRNYRADLGKWQTSDPLGYPDGWNNLAYVNNGVLGAVDPLGLCSEVWTQDETGKPVLKVVHTGIKHDSLTYKVQSDDPVKTITLSCDKSVTESKTFIIEGGSHSFTFSPTIMGNSIGSYTYKCQSSSDSVTLSYSCDIGDRKKDHKQRGEITYDYYVAQDFIFKYSICDEAHVFDISETPVGVPYFFKKERGAKVCE